MRYSLADKPCCSEPCTSRTCDHRWMSWIEVHTRINAIGDVLVEMILAEVRGPSGTPTEKAVVP